MSPERGSAGNVAVYCNPDDAAYPRSIRLAAALGVPTVTRPDATGPALILAFGPRGLELRSMSPRLPGALRVDFASVLPGLARPADPSRLLFRAIGPLAKTRTVLDATAGLARDAFVMARRGYRVLAVERCPVLVALVEDALQRAASAPALAEVLHQRFKLIPGDARDVLPTLCSGDAPDVVYLDPMYPPKRKSALVRKELRILRSLVGDDGDAGELLDLARAVARRHVVVKRLRLAPPLGPNPSRAYVGRSTRYDVYATLGRPTG